MDSHSRSSSFPLAYLITIRTFGSWLHGDERSSVDRHGFNIYGSPRRPENQKLIERMRSNLRVEPVLFTGEQCQIIEEAIKEVCEFRRYKLWAVNVRTNHAHAVVSAAVRPEPIADSFKSYATRKLRQRGAIQTDIHPWARGKSRRYLWKAEHVQRAIHYVLYEQGEKIPDFDD